MRNHSLPRVSAAAVERLNRLARRRDPAPIDALLPGLTLSLSPRNPARAPGEGLFELAAHWGGARVRVRADRQWVGEVVQHALGSELPDGAPPLVQRAMVEASIGTAMTRLEQATERHVHLVDEQAPPHAEHGIDWQVHANGRVSEGELWLDDAGLDQLVALASPVVQPTEEDRRFDQLPLRIRLAIGWVDLALGQLKTLREHDVLLLDESWVRPDGAIAVRIGRDSALLGRIDGSRIEITQAWMDIMDDRLDDDEFDDDFDEFEDDEDEDEEDDEDEDEDDFDGDGDGDGDEDDEPEDEGDAPKQRADLDDDEDVAAPKPSVSRVLPRLPLQRPQVEPAAALPASALSAVAVPAAAEAVAVPALRPPTFSRRSAAARLDTLPVRVSFDLGQRSLTLAELREIGPGHVFELGRELRRCVQVRANGRLVGEGELVDVDGRLGVCLLSIHGAV